MLIYDGADLDQFLVTMWRQVRAARLWLGHEHSSVLEWSICPCPGQRSHSRFRSGHEHSRMLEWSICPCSGQRSHSRFRYMGARRFIASTGGVSLIIIPPQKTRDWSAMRSTNPNVAISTSLPATLSLTPLAPFPHSLIQRRICGFMRLLDDYSWCPNEKRGHLG